MSDIEKYLQIDHNKEIYETLSDGCLGSEIDEGRSEMRNALRIAEFRESIDFLTRIAATSLKSLSHLPQCCSSTPPKDK